MNKEFKNVKCNCGHLPKDHFQNSGWCYGVVIKGAWTCGCTWYYPNDNYIKRQKLKSKKVV